MSRKYGRRLKAAFSGRLFFWRKQGSVEQERCLVCGQIPVDHHHFPRTRRYGQATIPLCRRCHTVAHTGRLTGELVELAPEYWRSVGQWDEVCEEFDTWMARREYLEATR